MRSLLTWRSSLARRRRGGFSLLELMTVVAIIALLATAAIPVFGRYIRRSKATEAVMSLRRIYNGAVSYFSADHSDADGEILPHTFPLSTAPMPDLSSLGPTPIITDTWDGHPTWDALGFSVSDPHFYAYQYDSSGEDRGAAFTASAFGDLDGDQIFSTFVRFGTVDNMAVRGGQMLYVQQQTE